jgi:hypothetical protein
MAITEKRFSRSFLNVVMDHRIAAVEERLSALERAMHSSPLPSGGIAQANDDAV